jgi:hypothetical protein
MELAEARVAGVVIEVLRERLREEGARAIIVLEPISPEGSLLLRWCESEGLPAEAAEAPRREPGTDSIDALELERAAARSRARRIDALTANPLNRTALLLAVPPPEPLLPLGDVPASRVARWMGDWSAPGSVRALADAAGGIERLDAVLHDWLDRRVDMMAAFAALTGDAAQAVQTAFRRGRAARRATGLVPKLGWRTVGHDLRF